jgi:hypothetical protein
MLAETTREGLLIAPGDERIDQPIAPAAREVVVPEAEAPHALLVVRQPQVEAAGLASHAPRLRRLALEEDFLLDAQPGLGPEVSRARAVCSGGTRYECEPTVRRAARRRSRGPRAASTVGTGVFGSGAS